MPSVRFFLISALVLLALRAPLHGEDPVPPRLPAGCRQAILVTSGGWNAVEASLQRWERAENGEWRARGDHWPVRLGRTGMAWGRGLHEIPASASLKKEGDSKAPAGIFLLGPAFGNDPERPAGSRFPWRQATERDFYVDDPESSTYNQWVRLEAGQAANWRSAERMRRGDLLYEFGLVVQHNMTPIVPGGGSAIFLHVWAGPESATAGCTSMERSHLLELLAWLDPSARPVLVQAPLEAWADLRMGARSL